MKAFVGVTDMGWYEFLEARRHLTEVNFWRPSGRGFGAIATGEPFVFKTHAPHNRLVGGGFLSSFAALTVSEAWGFFGEGNGVASLGALQAAIAKYRRDPVTPEYDPEIGCIILRDVFFVDRGAGLRVPPDFAPNIVMGKGYDLAETNGSVLEAALERLILASGLMTRDASSDESGTTTAVPGPVFGDPRLVAHRVGQRAFKALVLAAYERRCAITGARIKPTLEAAHIRPVSDGGENRVDNGLLLRSDVHTLFDTGYLGVDPKRRLHVSPALRTEFGNGEEFYVRAGTELMVQPSRRADRPGSEFLEWHMDTRYRSA